MLMMDKVFLFILRKYCAHKYILEEYMTVFLLFLSVLSYYEKYWQYFAEVKQMH